MVLLFWWYYIQSTPLFHPLSYCTSDDFKNLSLFFFTYKPYGTARHMRWFHLAV